MKKEPAKEPEKEMENVGEFHRSHGGQRFLEDTCAAVVSTEESPGQWEQSLVTWSLTTLGRALRKEERC